MANNFKRFVSDGITVVTTVYTCPASTQTTVIGMTVANSHSTDISATITLNSIDLIRNAPIATGSALVPIGGDQKLVLEPGDTLKVTPSNSADVIVSLLEIT